MRGGDSFSPWQSFADLAMGLMAVFALILVMLLWRQGRTNAELRVKTEQLEAERARFAFEMLALLGEAEGIVEAQDRAEAFVQELFAEESCELALDAKGRLTHRSSGGDAGGSADLYELGETRLNPAGERALQSCAGNFQRLLYCLSPGRSVADGEDAGPTSEETLLRCALDRSVSAPVSAQDRQRVEQLRRGIEALVLEGNTDRVPPSARQIPRVHSSTIPLKLDEASRSFVRNAHLGSERARQALGHLVHLVQERSGASDTDALAVLMSRVRIESPSFGRFQAGPREWRAEREPSCDEQDRCPSARNLSLRLRWKKSELRRPFEAFRRRFCSFLARPNCALARGLTDRTGARRAEHELLGLLSPTLRSWLETDSQDLGELREQLRCPSQE